MENYLCGNYQNIANHINYLNSFHNHFMAISLSRRTKAP